jgi:hypothetical protein
MEKSALSHEACCKTPTTTCPCPICGNAGRKVTQATLDNHVTSPLREEIGDVATFCLNPQCDVVYCSPTGKVIRKGQTKFPVTIKDPGDETFVCYCFEHKRGDLRRDLMRTGTTDIPDRIRREVKAGRCDCERKNPQGACCLGNVAAAIKEIEGQMRQQQS